MRNHSASSNVIASDRDMIAGIRKHMGKSESIVIDNEKYSASDLVKLLESRVDAHAPVALAKAAWIKVARAKVARMYETKDLVAALRLYFLVKYGASGDTLADFGLAPMKRAKPTLEKRFRAAQKARATRTSKRTGAPAPSDTANPSTNGARAAAAAHATAGGS